MASRQGDSAPELKDNALYRSKDIILLLYQVTLNDQQTSIVSDGVPCQGSKHFNLYIRVKSSSAPTTVQFIVQFFNPWSNTWHDYRQGLFANLYYEDTVTATEVDECFSGDCAGRQMRIKAVGTGTTASATFTVSAAIELWN